LTKANLFALADGGQPKLSAQGGISLHACAGGREAAKWRGTKQI